MLVMNYGKATKKNEWYDLSLCGIVFQVVVVCAFARAYAPSGLLYS